jgi:hypothetical protein
VEQDEGGVASSPQEEEEQAAGSPIAVNAEPHERLGPEGSNHVDDVNTHRRIDFDSGKDGHASSCDSDTGIGSRTNPYTASEGRERAATHHDHQSAGRSVMLPHLSTYNLDMMDAPHTPTGSSQPQDRDALHGSAGEDDFEDDYGLVVPSHIHESNLPSPVLQPKKLSPGKSLSPNSPPLTLRDAIAAHMNMSNRPDEGPGGSGQALAAPRCCVR